MSKLGEVLREERVRRGLSQLQLAKACHVDRSMISNYELGKDRIPHDVVCRAIKALGSNKLRAQGSSPD
jgi:transcriptional regulator with XRE-family HTH domain